MRYEFKNGSFISLKPHETYQEMTEARFGISTKDESLLNTLRPVKADVVEYLNDQGYSRIEILEPNYMIVGWTHDAAVEKNCKHANDILGILATRRITFPNAEIEAARELMHEYFRLKPEQRIFQKINQREMPKLQAALPAALWGSISAKIDRISSSADMEGAFYDLKLAHPRLNEAENIAVLGSYLASVRSLHERQEDPSPEAAYKRESKRILEMFPTQFEGHKIKDSQLHYLRHMLGASRNTSEAMASLAELRKNPLYQWTQDNAVIGDYMQHMRLFEQAQEQKRNPRRWS